MKVALGTTDCLDSVQLRLEQESLHEMCIQQAGKPQFTGMNDQVLPLDSTRALNGAINNLAECLSLCRL